MHQARTLQGKSCVLLTPCKVHESSCLQTVLEQVCRLARIIASPHEVGHCMLVAEGCPGRCTVVVNLAAHLCGFSIFKVNPNPMHVGQEYKLDSFKADLVLAYIRAGVKVSQQKSFQIIKYLDDNLLVKNNRSL